MVRPQYHRWLPWSDPNTQYLPTPIPPAHGIGDGFLATQRIVSKAHVRRGVGVVDAEQLAGIGVIAVDGDKGIAGGIRAGPGAGGLCKKKI